MDHSEALEIAKDKYGENIYLVRKPQNGFTSTNSVPSFLGEITSPKGHNYSWWVYRVQPGRPIGFSPINGEKGAMVKKTKAWSMPDSDWEWLESQSNQSEVIRKAITQYRQQYQV